MRSLIGVDLNGVHDWLARFDDTDRDTSKDEIIDLGLRSAMIRLQEQRGRWVADKQAETAPHGRGPGWGEIGKSGNRLPVLEMLDGLCCENADRRTREAVVSSLPGIVGDTDRAVFAVPDIPAYGEAFQDRLIDLLAPAMGRRPLLLWRPVAALLGYIRQRGSNLQPGANVAILSLMADGLHLSTLSLDRDRHDGQLVPERRKSGESAGTAFCGIQLVKNAQRHLAENSPMKLEEIEAAAITPWRSAIGAGQQTQELARLATNRGWIKFPKLTLRFSSPGSASTFPVAFMQQLSEAKIILIEGPFADNVEWRQEVENALRDSANLRGTVQTLDSATVALGCLEAAQRERDGQSIYFDFLPQLEINASVNNAPQFVNLIVPGARCRGGDTFRGYAPGNFFIQRGATRPDFWLFKEGFAQGRRAAVSFDVNVDRQCSLVVSVEQTPGQGSAVVQISSPDLEEIGQTPIILNWNAMEIVEDSRDAILEHLQNRSPSGRHYPNTHVKQGHAGLWFSNHPKGSLVRELELFCEIPLVQRRRVNERAWNQLRVLRNRFSKPESVKFLFQKLNIQIETGGNFHALNADGTLPRQEINLPIPIGASEVIDKALSKCARDFIILHKRVGNDIDPKLLGDIVGFASWCFWRCPEEIIEFILEAYEDRLYRKVHRTLIRQGVARVIYKREHLERYFYALEGEMSKGKNIAAANYAGLSRVLGTIEYAASILTPLLADRIAMETLKEIEVENRKGGKDAYKTRFKYAMLMLAGLLRYREAQSNFLHPEEMVTKQLLTQLTKVMKRSKEISDLYPKYSKRMSSMVDIISEIKKHIQMEGGDPNIILYIDSIVDE